MSENRSIMKIIYNAVINSMHLNGDFKGNDYTANGYQTKHYSGQGKRRTSGPKRKFHRQKK